MTDAQLQQALGADRYVASLREAVDASLAALGDPPAREELATRIASAETAIDSKHKDLRTVAGVTLHIVPGA